MPPERGAKTVLNGQPSIEAFVLDSPSASAVNRTRSVANLSRKLSSAGSIGMRSTGSIASDHRRWVAFCRARRSLRQMLKTPTRSARAEIKMGRRTSWWTTWWVRVEPFQQRSEFFGQPVQRFAHTSARTPRQVGHSLSLP